MEKKLYIFLLICFLANLYQPVYSAHRYDYNALNNELMVCRQQNTSSCFKKMLTKYDLNQIRLYYASALIKEKNYKTANVELDNIIRNEIQNKNIVDSAKKLKESINELNTTMKKANQADDGDYYNELSNAAKWERPFDLKVYIDDKSSKANLFKNSFYIWDNSLNNVHFVFVGSKDKADIVCSFVDYLDGNTAGITYHKIYEKPGKGRFFYKAEMQIARNQPHGAGPYTDKNLSSTILHEIGHAIGILGHSKNLNDVMYYSTASYRNGTISRRDVNTIKKIYGKQY